MPDAATDRSVLNDLERIVVASVAITARALADVGPDLTLIQWRVLVLVDRPLGMPVGAIAAALGAKIAATSRLIGRIRARGLVETRRSDDDARVVLVSLTDRGLAVRRRVVNRRRRALRSAIADARLPADAASTLDRLALVLEALG
ncbi:MAG TPA: MarR family transcriptional regulator [Candidatus Limnocylindrales bacterium]|nr:MarR family transcriptional regulator [Candidatus Limnocylindrales bacterium]